MLTSIVASNVMHIGELLVNDKVKTVAHAYGPLISALMFISYYYLSLEFVIRA